MSDRAALLAAIVAEPDEDTPRLVYADWLDENAADLPDPAEARTRARFVRAQIELRRGLHPACDRAPAGADALGVGGPGPPAWCRCPRCVSLRWQSEATAAYLPGWEAEALRPVLARPRQTALRPAVRFRRGFAAVLSIATDDYMTHAGALFERNPIADVVWPHHEPVPLLGGYGWQSAGRWSPGYDWSGCLLPAAVFKQLPRGNMPRGLRLIRLYDTPTAARGALSVALVAYGRHRVSVERVSVERARRRGHNPEGADDVRCG
jgi:uncharacterized protein (TIGR02996 family)